MHLSLQRRPRANKLEVLNLGRIYPSLAVVPNSVDSGNIPLCFICRVLLSGSFTFAQLCTGETFCKIVASSSFL